MRAPDSQYTLARETVTVELKKISCVRKIGFGDQKEVDEMDRETIEKRVRELGFWYHNLDLGGVMTNPKMGDYPMDRWKALEPFVPKDLRGKTVLDLACNSGFFSTMLKQRGAEYVLGIDVPAKIEQARLVSEVYKVDVDLRSQNVYTFVLTNKMKFDIVLFLGLFYHLRYPLLVLDKAAEFTKEKLFFQSHIVGGPPATGEGALLLRDDYPITEDAIFDHPDYPKTFFIEKSYNGDCSNWWFPNESCVWAMLRSAGFQNIVKCDTPLGDRCFICDAPAAMPTHDFDFRLSRCQTFPTPDEADFVT
jgi:tRNA (mo5U34)-methyltransferase